jgi:hypothetical protein
MDGEIGDPRAPFRTDGVGQDAGLATVGRHVGHERRQHVVELADFLRA